jgi:hypothetical protein
VQYENTSVTNLSLAPVFNIHVVVAVVSGATVIDGDKLV